MSRSTSAAARAEGLAVRARGLAVRTVKPRVSDELWAILRDPASAVHRAPQRPSLTEYATTFGTDKWGQHRYTQHYERHLAHLRDDAFTLVELGIGGYAHERQGGASLRMWKAFFPRAQIVGLDIEDKSFVDEDRIRSYRGSQVDPVVLDRILAESGPVQVVVDDGSHRPEHVRESFARLFPRLAADGIYVIEDTQTSYWPSWGGSQDLHDPSTTMALVKDLIDGLNHEEFADDDYDPTYADRHVVAVHAYHNLVVIEKGSNREGSNAGTRFASRVDAVADHPAGPIAQQRAPYSATDGPR